LKIFLIIFATADIPHVISITKDSILEDYWISPFYDQLMRMDEGTYLRITAANERRFIVVRVQ
jgi:hypothetical protein